MKKIITVCTLLLFGLWTSAQSFWEDLDPGSISTTVEKKAYLTATAHRALSLDYTAMKKHLQKAPFEFTAEAKSAPLQLSIPLPDGSNEVFGIYEISIMEPGLAAAFPMIKTYAGASLNDPSERIRLETGALGFHATVFGEKVAVVGPMTTLPGELYASYFIKSTPNDVGKSCGTTEIENEEALDGTAEDKEFLFTNKSLQAPVDLRTYRLAVATTSEYSNLYGNTPASVLSAVTSVLNQTNAIYEIDHAIRLVLIANTTETFFFAADGDDGYTNGNAGVMLGENPAILFGAYGNDGFDVGHVFGSTNGGGTIGIARLASVCGTNKASGASNLQTFVPEDFYITVTHELGHQFSAQHGFNFCDNENENPPTAYQPGGGSTIMCYTSCGSNNVQDYNDSYFHINAMERIKDFSNNSLSGGSCAEVIATSNTTPETSIPIAGGFKIPISTPFELTGEATDAEGDNMTYTWEEYDLGPMSPLGSPIGTAPLFRSYPPTESLTRVFPNINNLVANVSHVNEVLPTISRPLTFRFTARDNNAEAGGYSYSEIAFESTEAAGPFLVSLPNTGSESWEVGKYMEVAWDVANTDGSQVNCQMVNIRLSTDGGFNYPVMLLENTPNDGSAFVVVPDAVSDQARVRVEAADNIFFDISNNNFSIVPPTAPGFTLVSSPELGTVCVPDVFEVQLQTSSLLGFTDMISFSVGNLPDGAVATFDPAQVAPGGTSTLSIDFSGAVEDGGASIAILAEANGAANSERSVELNIVNSDFSALQLTAPAGASGTSTLPDYGWTGLPNGLSYNIEIASDPDFANVIDAASGLASPNYPAGVTLDENTIYYWHVSVSNECGTGSFSDAAAFKTVSQSCNSFTNNTTQPISGSGLPEILSVINLPTGGEISDVNVKNIKGDHDAFGDVEFHLVGPDATSVLLMQEQPCGSTNPFNVGFDDESPFTDIPCPPTDGTSYRPQEALGAFNGKDAAGDWTLQLNIVNTIGAGGSFDGWTIEVCGGSSALDPFLVTNDTLAVPPNDSRLIYSNKLVVSDDDNAPDQLKFTILKNTDFGFVSKNGVQLGAGDSFTMQDVYSSQMEYTNTEPTAIADHFTFYVEDGNSGFFGTPSFNIVIDEDAEPSAVEGQVEEQGILVYPNPASDRLTIQLKDGNRGISKASLFNAQGQLVLSRQPGFIFGKIQIEVGGLPAGMYLLQLTSPEGVFAKKVVIE
ncbi:MAG TPA: T9SS type A sorting domain-containing protein [Bacteroidetes bacterium]|nr:T9SS type A sorting domain-containing protein [Bacteroidota bacterium]